MVSFFKLDIETLTLEETMDHAKGGFENTRKERGNWRRAIDVEQVKASRWRT